MMKLSKDLFSEGEVLFIGYSSKNNAFSKSIYQALTQNGIKVYPVNTNANGNYDIKVYNSLKDVPRVPQCAYVLTSKNNTENIVGDLAKCGVKKILFQGKANVDTDTLNECSKLGIEAAIGCPMMLFGSGLHRIHAFFAGVKR